MTTLVDRAAYDLDETGYWSRLPWATGLFYGSLMGLFAFIALLRTDGLVFAATFALAVVVLGGAFFGFVFSKWMRWSTRRLLHRIYEGDLRIVAKPPGPESFPYRLPCSLFVSNTNAIGGVLYLGRGGLLFQPHQRVRAKLAVPLHITLLSGIRISDVTLDSNWRLKVFARRAPHLMQVQWPGGTARFGVPTPTTTIPVVQRKVDELSRAA